MASCSETSAKRRNAAKRKVLSRYPQAVCYRDKYGRFAVADARHLGGGVKEAEAWEDAARRLDQ